MKKTILTRVDPQLKEQLRRDAIREGRSLSAHVAMLLASIAAAQDIKKERLTRP